MTLLRSKVNIGLRLPCSPTRWPSPSCSSGCSSPARSETESGGPPPGSGPPRSRATRVTCPPSTEPAAARGRAGSTWPCNLDGLQASRPRARLPASGHHATTTSLPKRACVIPFRLRPAPGPRRPPQSTALRLGGHQPVSFTRYFAVIYPVSNFYSRTTTTPSWLRTRPVTQRRRQRVRLRHGPAGGRPVRPVIPAGTAPIPGRIGHDSGRPRDAGALPVLGRRIGGRHGAAGGARRSLLDHLDLADLDAAGRVVARGRPRPCVNWPAPLFVYSTYS